jgi:hypothetical protein
MLVASKQIGHVPKDIKMEDRPVCAAESTLDLTLCLKLFAIHNSMVLQEGTNLPGLLSISCHLSRVDDYVALSTEGYLCRLQSLDTVLLN